MSDLLQNSGPKIPTIQPLEDISSQPLDLLDHIDDLLQTLGETLTGESRLIPAPVHAYAHPNASTFQPIDRQRKCLSIAQLDHQNQTIYNKSA